MVVVPTQMLGQGCAVLIPLWYQSMGAQEDKRRWPGAQFGCEISKKSALRHREARHVDCGTRMVVVPTLVLGQGCAVLIPLWYQSMGAQEDKCRWPGAQFGCDTDLAKVA